MTDLNVQYFSHLNGLVLSNTWGDMVRLLDTCLVNGLTLPSISTATIDSSGNIALTFSAAHKCLLFQIVELTGFTNASLNGKYRISSVPDTTSLVLKASLTGTTISTIGTAKLSSLGYEIIFRDSADVKRVYRAKNPTTQHPFIRVDESLTSADGTTAVYTSTYAKYAMVGLLESIDDIDDVNDPNVLQLPFDTTDPDKNWTIAGTGSSVVRGWSRWYWVRASHPNSGSADNAGLTAGNRQFTLVGDVDCFYLNRALETGSVYLKLLSGVGLYTSNLDVGVIPNWCLLTTTTSLNANTSIDLSSMSNGGGVPLNFSSTAATFITPLYNPASKLGNHVVTTPIMYTYNSGGGDIGGNNVSALAIPFFDSNKYLRGSLKHVLYSGNSRGNIHTTPILSDTSMYVYDSSMRLNGNAGGFYFYLGEL